jgi:hypothetical protein
MSPRSGRSTKTLEFSPLDVTAVADELVRLRHAASGWINVLPGIDEEAAPEPAPGFFAFLGNRAPAVSMATVMPPSAARRATEGPTVGVMHPTGARAVARLAEASVDVPGGWTVRQDHSRRGLLVRTPVDVGEVEVVTWSVRAAGALCRAEMTGRWRAVVYLPKVT